MMILSLQVFNGGVYLFSSFPRSKGLVVQADHITVGEQRFIMFALERAAVFAVNVKYCVYQFTLPVLI